MNTIQSLEWRYATKKFDTNKRISNSKLNTILKAFNLTATSYGLQPVKLVVIDDKEVMQQLVEHSMGQQQVAQASHLLVFCINTKINAKYIKNYFKLVKDVRNTPDEILQPFRDFLINDFKNKPKKQIKDWATKQAYLTMGNLLTVCALEGIDACPMEGFTPKQYDKILGLKTENLKSVLVMPIGYRADDDMFATLKKVRKPLSEVVINL